jgi:anti-sigma factor RsiW
MKSSGRVSDAELHAFVDGQLSDGRAREVSDWILDHPLESLRVSGWRTQNEAIRRAFPTPPRERIVAPLRSEEPAPLPEPGRKAPSIIDYRARMRRRRALAVAIAFAAGATAAGGLAIMFERVGQAPPQPTPVRVELVRAGADTAALAVSAWRAYALDRQHAVETAVKDRAALAAWIAERTGLTPLPEAGGARLIGGRVLPGHAANAAFLLYETGDGERIALVAEPATAGAVVSPPDNGDRIRAVAWTSGGFDFGLAGVIARARLDALATSFAEQRKP